MSTNVHHGVANHLPLLSHRFHEIQPQTNLKMLPPAASSRKIVSATPKSVPYPVLQENTLVLSNFLVVGKRNGKLSLMFRQVCLLCSIIRGTFHSCVTEWDLNLLKLGLNLTNLCTASKICDGVAVGSIPTVMPMPTCLCIVDQL